MMNDEILRINGFEIVEDGLHYLPGKDRRIH